MGAALCICGAKSLKSVEPLQAKGISSSNGLNLKGQCYGGLTAPPGILQQDPGGKAAHTFGCICDGHNELITSWREGRSQQQRGPMDSPVTVQVKGVPLAAQVVERYGVLDDLGKGRYSNVLQVECKETHVQYALKVVQKSPVGFMAEEEGEGNSYQLEVRILNHCNHPNILKLHEVLYTTHQAYLFLELALGGDLFNRISTRGRYSETGAKSALRMIVGGVCYLHRNGITHRDLKLENLLCKSQSEDSQILIADFGLAHVNDRQGEGLISGCQGEGFHAETRTCMSATCGTVEYMSPEMLEGEEYCEKVDMWAVGVVSYVLLSGSMPFVEPPTKGGRVQLHQDIRKGQYSFPAEVWEGVSTNALDFIRQLLCVDVNGRLSASQASQQQWLLQQ